MSGVSGVSRGAYVWGIVLLAVSAAMSLMLVLEHLSGLSLPGCGEGSACAEAAASVWGKVPYVDWPVSFLGSAYFLGLLVVWLTLRRGVPAGVRYLVRFGALISVAFVVIMIVEGHLCQYCVAIHAGNLVFWIVVERVAGTRSGSLRGLATVTVVFVACSAVLAVAQWRERAAAEVQAEEDLTASTEAIIAATSQRVVEPKDLSEPVVQAAEPAEVAEPTEDEVTSRGFTGRYRLGPEKAAIRVVMISDYQCQECRRIENDVMRVFHRRDDMSVSFKHYPMCSDCNRNTDRRRHPNACWAARAAETAGILKGNDAFWEMHAWLFEQRGSFTRESFPSQLREFGYDATEFLRIMSGDETLELVKVDVEEAIGLGVWFTPTILINGVELRGWEAPNAVARAIEKLAATNPEPLSAAHDQPPAAREKLIGDWRAELRRQIPPAPAFRSSGPEDVTARVVMFGDYQHSGTAETDALIREVLAQRDDVRY
ncbi:MAG: thioredoxin domain-containing protein, partial [Planctomycetes bacterium]|nr:thioredoxin domain-containing protein [Planctomycetota bacterium]